MQNEIGLSKYVLLNTAIVPLDTNWIIQCTTQFKA